MDFLVSSKRYERLEAEGWETRYSVFPPPKTNPKPSLKVSKIDPKSFKRRPRDAQETPKRSKKRPGDAEERARDDQEAPKMHPRASESAKRAPKNAQEASKNCPNPPKIKPRKLPKRELGCFWDVLEGCVRDALFCR